MAGIFGEAAAARALITTHTTSRVIRISGIADEDAPRLANEQKQRRDGSACDRRHHRQRHKARQCAAGIGEQLPRIGVIGVRIVVPRREYIRGVSRQIRAHRHEPGVPEGKLAAHAVDQLQADRQDDVDRRDHRDVHDIRAGPVGEFELPAGEDQDREEIASPQVVEKRKPPGFGRAVMNRSASSFPSRPIVQTLSMRRSTEEARGFDHEDRDQDQKCHAVAVLRPAREITDHHRLGDSKQ